MDIEQDEMQFLGIFGIYKESFKVILTWRKIFSKITLTLILPLCFIFLAHQEISSLLFRNIMHTEMMLYHTRVNTQRYKRLSHILSSEWAYYLLFKFAYLTFLLIFSLLSTSAVVYTIASVYTGREVSFKRVMSVVPKVWKRLMVTFLCMFIAMFAYNVVLVLAFFLWAVTLGDTSVAIPTLIILIVVYFFGFLYISLVWHMASVVTVLEDSCGLKAMMKSSELLKGKLWTAIAIFFMHSITLFVIQYVFQSLVVHGWSVGMVNRGFYAVLCFLLLFMVILLGLVIQTVIYFVCKSYHHQNIDKSALSDHLEVYLGEYVPLKAKDVQLEQFQV